MKKHILFCSNVKEMAIFPIVLVVCFVKYPSVANGSTEGKDVSGNTEDLDKQPT